MRDDVLIALYHLAGIAFFVFACIYIVHVW